MSSASHSALGVEALLWKSSDTKGLPGWVFQKAFKDSVLDFSNTVKPLNQSTKIHRLLNIHVYVDQNASMTD